jgi:cytochrome c oxidase cbb3-type subunit I/II
VTAEISSNEAQDSATDSNTPAIARRYGIVAAVFLVLGAVAATFAALQAVFPTYFGQIGELSYGRMAPASRTLLAEGWLAIGLLGASLYAIAKVTGSEIRRTLLANVALALLAVGGLVGAAAIFAGFQTGIAGFEAPVWARAITVLGYVLAAISIASTARQNGNTLGTTGWYLTASAWWLAATGILSLVPALAFTPGVNLVPAMDGISGTILTSFASAGMTGLFVIVTSVGLLYFAATSLTGTDPSEPRRLGALGFWSVAIIWGSMGATPLIFSAAPDWYETLGVGIAIAAFVPLIAVAADLGLMFRGTVDKITDRASLRYASVAFLAFAGATGANVILTFRTTSAAVGFTTWRTGTEFLIVLGGATFAIFAAQSITRGGGSTGTSFHFSWSVSGLVGAVAGSLIGGAIVGFSWAAGPTGNLYVNSGSAWEITAVSLEPFALITGVSLALFAVAQIFYLITSFGSTEDEDLTAPDGAADFDLQIEGRPKYPTWRRLVWGGVTVWVTASLLTGFLPMLDPANTEATRLGETRVYPDGSSELAGRNLYISEGCVECHSQTVRPVAADVGLGAVSVAGDYANEAPVFSGIVRLGPDLMHFAGGGGVAPSLGDHLRDPQATRAWSVMPSYSYLSDSEIDQLVSYIQTLKTLR